LDFVQPHRPTRQPRLIRDTAVFWRNADEAHDGGCFY
jgi:hypothetical protein